MNQIMNYLIIAPPIFLALTFHEFSHAYVANRLGDPTAKLMGRLTMNPLYHLDLLGTAMLFIAGIGWAKPVPVNPLNLSNPKRDLLWVSLAGPGSNMILALLFGICLRIIGITGFYSGMETFITMIFYGMTINIALAFFNLIPIHPLDGSKILMGLIPAKYEEQFEPLMQYGSTILIGIIVLGFITRVPIFNYVINPFIRFFSYVFGGIG